MSVALFPIGDDVDALWLRYVSIARAVADNRSLLTDLDTHKAMARAYEEWRLAFRRSDKP